MCRCVFVNKYRFFGVGEVGIFGVREVFFLVGKGLIFGILLIVKIFKMLFFRDVVDC